MTYGKEMPQHQPYFSQKDMPIKLVSANIPQTSINALPMQ
jgi:hypothetical protein